MHLISSILTIFTGSVSLKLFLFTILFLPNTVQSQSLSGSERMDYEIRRMITDLKMTETVQSKFIKVYSQYGEVMRKAKDSGINRWSLYMIFIKASRERDLKMKEILTNRQYEFFLKRQSMIDKIASSM